MTREEALSILKTFRITGDKNHEAFDMAIKSLEAWEKVEKDVHSAIDNALMYGYGDNYINACETILQFIQEQEMCLKMDSDSIDIDKAVEHYEGTLEMLKGIDLEVDG